jgi:hypothetical protein
MLKVHSQGQELGVGGGMNPVMKKHLELEIKTLQKMHLDMLTILFLRSNT